MPPLRCKWHRTWTLNNVITSKEKCSSSPKELDSTEIRRRISAKRYVCVCVCVCRCIGHIRITMFTSIFSSIMTIYLTIFSIRLGLMSILIYKSKFEHVMTQYKTTRKWWLEKFYLIGTCDALKISPIFYDNAFKREVKSWLLYLTILYSTYLSKIIYVIKWMHLNTVKTGVKHLNIYFKYFWKSAWTKYFNNYFLFLILY